ncbi:MAG TPA: PQQ-binding-like beta-propeller repeat protein [Fimbriimonadales bacterium]|nr:PQQ-binding-like beta-propeller repeat protein [Fimbriimonadales bacterium]
MKAYISVLLSLVILPGFAQINPAPPVRPLPHPWPMKYANAQRTGQSLYPGPILGKVSWKVPLANWAPGIAVSRNGNVILGDCWNDAPWSGEDYVIVLTKEGELAWRVKIPSFPWGAGQGVRSTAALDSAGNVYISGSNGILHKFDPFGNKIWEYYFSGGSGVSNDASPAVCPDETIRGFHFFEGLYGLNPDKTLIFNGGPGSGTPAVAPNYDMCTGTPRSNEPHTFPAVIYANANGTLRWIYYTLYGGGSTPVFGNDGTVYVGVDTLGTYAFNPNGTVKWQQTWGSWTQAPALGKNGQLYKPSGGSIRAFNPENGATLWTANIGGTILDGLALDSRDWIYATNSNGEVAALKPNGQIVWKVKVCDEFVTSPAIGLYGTLYACGKVGFDYFVYCIR